MANDVASDSVANDLSVDCGRCPIERFVEERFEDEIGVDVMGMAQQRRKPLGITPGQEDFVLRSRGRRFA